MFNYSVHKSELITDSVLNSTGNISEWESVLNLNSFTDWNPDLNNIQTLSINGIVSANFQRQLILIPANNSEQVNQSTLYSDLINVLDSVTVVPQELPEITITAIQNYKVRGNEEIRDVLLNSTGTINNWEEMLNLNLFVDWNPDLKIGEQITVN